MLYGSTFVCSLLGTWNGYSTALSPAFIPWAGTASPDWSISTYSYKDPPLPFKTPTVQQSTAVLTENP